MSSPGMQLQRERKVSVALIAFDDYTDIDLIFMWDLFTRVARPDWEVRILGDAAEHRSMTGLTVPTHGHVREARSASAVLFASGRGTRAKMNDAAWLAEIELDPERQLIGSMCSGALLLGALGLLRGRRATTYPTAKPLLERLGVTVVEQPFVCEGNVATAGGCLAAQYLVGWVLERLGGEKLRDFVIASCQPVGEGLTYATNVEVPPAP
ncbi:thiamine biosynthesis protein ThiJ [Sorangium cellulosum]|uniref:Thiamine biosynthesis protein ThiJ n=1 Tax=Sorangium cellulosum TaxID=56 RepID=A0A150RNZ0_SORCE|nr:thiamine biosynthesis protein ThiJ [Sorangium cellulosum]